MPTPKLVHQPNARRAIGRGVDVLAAAIAPTLGPMPGRPVAQNQARFELLDDGGLIARRIFALPDREDDVGAMLLRQALWQVREQVGDGSATAAVIYQRVYHEGLRFIAAGVNPMRLRTHLMSWLPKLRGELLASARLIRSEADLRAIAWSVCYDDDMARALGEVMSTVGQYGQVDIRSGHGRFLEYHYVDGVYWKGGAQSREMLRGGLRPVAELADAAIVITDMDIDDARALAPLLKLALRNGIQKLLLIVKSISDAGIAVTLDQRLRKRLQTLIVKVDSPLQDERNQAYEDIAVLTGATPVLEAAGQSLADARAEDFGYARWAWADKSNFGFASGKGDPIQIRAHAHDLRDAYERSDEDDDRARLLKRLGKLQGGLATVTVGGIAQDEIRQRKELAERSIRALRRAVAGGVIVGGGVSLRNLSAALLADAPTGESLEESAARQILAEAMAAPMRQILRNAGLDAGEILAKLQSCDSQFGYDVMRGEIADMGAAGVLDVAQVQVEALQRAVASAALALTIDVLVLHRQPETMTEP